MLPVHVRKGCVDVFSLSYFAQPKLHFRSFSINTVSLVMGIMLEVQKSVALNNPQNDLLPLTCCVPNTHTSPVLVTGKRNETHQYTSVTSRGASYFSFIINACVHELCKNIFYLNTDRHKLLKFAHWGVTLLDQQS